MTSQRKKTSEGSYSLGNAYPPSGGSHTGKIKARSRKHTLLLSVLAIALLGLFGFFDSSFARLGAYNRADLLILGCEMLTEAGPDFRQAARCHKKNLEKCIQHMEQRRFATILSRCPIYGRYSPKEGLDAALKILQDAITEERTPQEVAVAIWRAGEEVMHFREQTTGLFRAVGWYKPRRTPELVQDINDANEASGKALMNFRKHKNLQNAWLLCERNRRTTLLLFLARSGYDGQESIERGFQRILEESVKTKEEFTKTLKENSAERKLADMLTDSERRRCTLLESMRAGDMDKAYDLVWLDIEKAMQAKSRSEVLEIATKLEPEVQLWEEPQRQN